VWALQGGGLMEEEARQVLGGLDLLLKKADAV
jgi:hypothetical protein